MNARERYPRFNPEHPVFGWIPLGPVIDWIGNTPIEHGERGLDIDPVHPDACLCGRYELYYMCPGPGVGQMIVGAGEAAACDLADVEQALGDEHADLS